MLVAATAVTALAGCSLDSEPSEVCGSLELSAAQTRSSEQLAPTVFALSEGASEITIVRACKQFDACEAELLTQTISLGERGVPDQLLLTASGRWLTYRVGTSVYNIDLDSEALDAKGGPAAHELVGSLRGGDWLIYRTAATVHDSELWAYYVPGSDPNGESNNQPSRHFRIGEGLGAKFDLRVAAMGHRHVVARRILGNGEEELYLVRIAPARRHDELGTSVRGKPLLLARGKRFNRVIITTGPSPAEHGDPWEFQHEVPTDVQVIATSGEGSSARTLIYAVSNTDQIANFEGAVVSSPLPLEDIAGLSAVSPSGSHLAYITPRGSLALRKLQDDADGDRACMIRPATAARHALAGFAADGTLYFESRERSKGASSTSDRNADIVYAYDPKAEQFTALTDDSNSWRLYAVPPRPYEAEDGSTLPWAIVAYEGFYGARPGAPPKPLNYDDVNFLPRGDESLWLLEGEESRSFDDPHRVTLRRVQPTQTGGQTELEFDVKTADPSVLDHEQLRDRFTRAYSPKASVCVSTSQSASRTTPWATVCSTPEEPTNYLDSGLPQGEQL